jgi:hypothetical protein
MMIDSTTEGPKQMTIHTLTSDDLDKRRRRGGDDVLRDGDVLRIPLQLADSAIADVALALHDGMGGPAGRRPGYIFANGAAADVARAEAVTRHALRKVELENAWRSKPAPPIANATREEAYAAREKYLTSAWRTAT